LGYVEGQNLIIESRFSERSEERLPVLASVLVGSQVAVIVTGAIAWASAAKQATSSIPIVSLGLDDPVGAGLIASLARPGGNLTGLAIDTGPALAGKRLDLLREAVPAVSRVAILWNPGEPGASGRFAAVQEVARALGIVVLSAPVYGPDAFDEAFDTIIRERVEAIALVPSPLLAFNRTRVAEFALETRLPTMGSLREEAAAGYLMAYGARLTDLARRAAYYVDRILKGASPADLPVEQPREFDFVINLKTAHALGLTIPDQVLLQATEVIQ
jgi:putative ABC transport system substrate-binding protein